MYGSWYQGSALRNFIVLPPWAWTTSGGLRKLRLKDLPPVKDGDGDMLYTMVTTSTEASVEAATMQVSAERWTEPVSAEVTEV